MVESVLVYLSRWSSAVRNSEFHIEDMHHLHMGLAVADNRYCFGVDLPFDYHIEETVAYLPWMKLASTD